MTGINFDQNIRNWINRKLDNRSFATVLEILMANVKRSQQQNFYSRLKEWIQKSTNLNRIAWSI